MGDDAFWWHDLVAWSMFARAPRRGKKNYYATLYNTTLTKTRTRIKGNLLLRYFRKLFKIINNSEQAASEGAEVV